MPTCGGNAAANARTLRKARQSEGVVKRSAKAAPKVSNEVRMLHETAISVELPKGKRARERTNRFTEQNPEYQGPAGKKETKPAGKKETKPAGKKETKRAVGQVKEKEAVQKAGKKSKKGASVLPKQKYSPPKEEVHESFKLASLPPKILNAYAQWYAEKPLGARVQMLDPKEGAQVSSTPDKDDGLYFTEEEATASQPGEKDAAACHAENCESWSRDQLLLDLFINLLKVMPNEGCVAPAAGRPMGEAPPEYEKWYTHFGDILLTDKVCMDNMDKSQADLMKLILWPVLTDIFFVKVPGQRQTKGSMDMGYGLAGTGKTRGVTAAFQFMKQLGIPVSLLMVSADQLYSSHFGDGEKQVKSLFDFIKYLLKLKQYVIVLFDECDTIFQKAGKDNEHFRSIVNMLKVVLALAKQLGVQIVLLTNELDKVDPAIRSRCSHRIPFGKPGSKALGSVFRTHLNNKDYKNFQVYTKLDDSFYTWVGEMIHGIKGADYRTVEACVNDLHDLIGSPLILSNYCFAQQNKARKCLSPDAYPLYVAKVVSEDEAKKSVMDFIEASRRGSESGGTCATREQEEQEDFPSHVYEGPWGAALHTSSDGQAAAVDFIEASRRGSESGDTCVTGDQGDVPAAPCHPARGPGNTVVRVSKDGQQCWFIPQIPESMPMEMWVPVRELS